MVVSDWLGQERLCVAAAGLAPGATALRAAAR